MDNVIILSGDYSKAVELTQHIKANVQAAQNSMLDICRAIAQMRDGKLYKELGYQNFADYCESELNIHRNQGIKYARIGTTLTEENAQLLGISETLGAEKLYLLSMFEPEDRQEAADGAESMTVKELKEKLEDLRKQNGKLMDKVEEAEKKADDSRKKESEAWGKVSVLRTDSEMQQAKIKQLQAEKTELESRPVDVAVEPDRKAIEELNQKHAAELKQLQEKHRTELEAANAKLVEAQNRTVEQGTVTVVNTKETFKAFFSNVTDSFSRLFSFIEGHKDDPEIRLYITKVSQLRDMIGDKLDKFGTTEI